MQIKKSEFLISSATIGQCPKTEGHEYAFIGRSNVGKSSLINMLTGRRSLAKTSSTPGKTILINHFVINDEWYLVDLPGYGYAKRGKAEQAKFQAMISSYILQRRQMDNLFLLVDCRHEPQKVDMQFIEWLGENNVPFSIVFTKADKLSKAKLTVSIDNYLKVLAEQWEELPPYFVTSAETGQGKEEILSYIESINKGL